MDIRSLTEASVSGLSYRKIRGGFKLTATIKTVPIGLGTGKKTNRRIRRYVNSPDTFIPSRILSKFTYMSDKNDLKTCWMKITNPPQVDGRWSAGHAIARMNGGPCTEENIFPQNLHCNTGNSGDYVEGTNVKGKGGRSWRDFEIHLNTTLMERGIVEVSMTFKR